MPNRAFVRYKKCGNIVPGSLILTNGTYPEPDAGWIEVPIKMPCGVIKLTATATAGDPDEICFGGFYIQYGNNASVISGGGYAPTIAGVIANLNEAYGFLGVWEANGLDITINLKSDVAKKFISGLDYPEGLEWTLGFYCGG
jgi:hypothetical protein